MRILIATWHRNLIGGTEKYLKVLLPALLERGHEVGLLYEKNFDSTKECIDRAGEGPETWCLEELGTEATLERVRQWKPEVVYSHGLESTVVERALLRSYPTVLFAHTYYGACVSGRKCHTTPWPQPCTRTLGPGCLVLYYPRRCGGLNPTTMWRMYQHEMERNNLLNEHAAVLVASSHMLREFERQGVSANRLHLVELPITDGIPSTPVPAPRVSLGRILFVGRLMDVKGVHYLIKAIPRAAERLAQPLVLTVAGDGPDRESLQALAQRLGVTVEFTGWVDTPRKLELMRKADLLAVPSLWPEPFGLVGIEAGRWGIPAAGYAVGGIPDWLVAGETGELAPGDPPTVHGLTDAIVRALADRDHYAKLCRGAWRMANEFTLDRHLLKLEPILSAGQMVTDNVVHSDVDG